MFWRLLIVMTVVPAVELYLLLQLGRWLGPLPTAGIILFTGALGAALAKREGLGVLRQLKEDARAGIPPASRLVEGLLVLLGGALLITPGVFTDLCGFLLIIPPTRRRIAVRVKDWAASKITITTADGTHFEGGPVRPGPAAREVADRFDHPVR